MLRFIHLILFVLCISFSPSTFAMNPREKEDLSPLNPSKRQKILHKKSSESEEDSEESGESQSESEAEEASLSLAPFLIDSTNYTPHRSVIVSFLELKDHLALRLLSKGSKDAIDRLSFYPIDNSPLFILPFSSEIGGSTIRDYIYRFLDLAENRIVIASDQITDFPLITKLKTLQNQKPDLQVALVSGQNPHMRADLEQEINQSHMSFKEVVHQNSKMHNKFILVDDYGVLTGSPNATTSAYERNIETFIAIRNPAVNRLYSAYYDYLIKAANPFNAQAEDFIEVGQQMDTLNNLENCPLNVCLAPIRDIRPFITERITDSTIIAISMFLVSHARNNKQTDILSTLQRQTKNGGSSAVMKIDGKQYDVFPYVKTAVRTFDHNPNTKVYSVKLNNGTFHDKLLLLIKEGIPTVIIGSAGFTDNVQDNRNQENMISISRLPEIYHFFQAHFNEINDKNEKVREIKKVNK